MIRTALRNAQETGALAGVGRAHPRAGPHLGRALAGAVSGVERAARLGGEEFVLLLPGTRAAAAAARCGNLTSRIRAMDWSEMTGTHPVTASIGVATDADGRMSAADLMAAADQNLCAAKRSGRDRVVATTAG